MLKSYKWIAPLSKYTSNINERRSPRVWQNRDLFCGGRRRRQAPRGSHGLQERHRITGCSLVASSLCRECGSPQVGIVVPGSLPVWRVVPVPANWFPRRGFPLGSVRIPGLANRVPMQATVRLQGCRTGEASIALRHRTDVWPKVDMGL